MRQPDWWELVEFIISKIMECLAEGRSENEVLQTLQNPTDRDWRVLRRDIRRRFGIYGRTLRRTMRDIRGDHVTPGMIDHRALLEQAKSRFTPNIETA